jgi:outer membrane protein assembly factor BamA
MLITATLPGLAQEPAAAAEGTDLVDVMDILRRIRSKDQKPAQDDTVDYRKPMRAFAPVIGAKPSSGVIVGVAGNVGFFRGDPSTTRISSLVASATVTSKKQAGISAHTTMFGRDDRWLLELDHRVQWTSQETFGLGMSTQAASAELVRFDYMRLYQSMYVAVRRNLFVGTGLYFDRHGDVEPSTDLEATWAESAYFEYSAANGLPIDTQASAGPSVEIVYDSRDSFINPSRGWLARTSYRALFDDFLGGSSSWEKVTVDFRAYPALSSDRRHRLAMWAYADLVVDGTAPYFDLPATATDPYGRSGRGYAEGHFRGEKLAFVEVEYRAPLLDNGLLSTVIFVSTTTISNRESGEHLFDGFAWGGGAGVRLLLNKRSRTNLAFDIGFGENGNRGVYLGVQEAF